jgi:hypothetical protein
MYDAIRRKKAIFFTLIIAPFVFASCLKHNLPPYPTASQAYITQVYFQYRWADSNKVANGEPVVAVQNLKVVQQIDTAKGTIDCQITVPAASGDFNAYQRGLVSLDSLWAYIDISTGARVTPLGDAPLFASQGSFSSARQYQVTAADPAITRVWTITVTSFKK